MEVLEQRAKPLAVIGRDIGAQCGVGRVCVDGDGEASGGSESYDLVHGVP